MKVIILNQAEKKNAQTVMALAKRHENGVYAKIDSDLAQKCYNQGEFRRAGEYALASLHYSVGSLHLDFVTADRLLSAR